jgi:hypothetical protein
MATGTTKTHTSDQNNPGTEPSLSRLAGVRRWLGENVWLVIGGCVVLMMAPSAARDAESTEMRENRARIEDMTQTERDLLLSNFDAWRKLPPKDRRRLRDMHDVVSTDEGLSETLTEYHTWLASVSSNSYEFRDRLLTETDSDKRLRMIKGQLDRKRKGMGPNQQGGMQGPNDPATGPEAFFTGLQHGPFLFGRDFESVIDVIGEWCGVPRPTGERPPVVVLKYHLNVLDQAGTKLRDMRSGDGPVRVPGKVVADILNAISNEERRDEIAIVVGNNPTALLILLLRSIRSEDIRRIAMTNGPMLDEFLEQLPPQQRLDLKRLPDKERTMRLTWMWVERNIPGAMDSMKRFMWANREPGQGRFQPGNRKPGQKNRRPFFPDRDRDRSDTSSND